jgi:hypothetical protein
MILKNKRSRLIPLGLMAVTLSACGTTNSASSGNVTIKSSPLAGANAASLMKNGVTFASVADGISQGLAQIFFGIQNAHAAVSSFTSFKACNDTFKFIDSDGNQLSISGSQNPSVGQGLLTFSPSSTDAMTIGSLDIPAGTVLSEIDITFAVAPTFCQGVSYAIQFDPGTGPINITQNTEFKFKFGSGKTITADAQSLNLLLGSIVTAMVAKGTNLNDSTIQTINVGVAQ